MVQTWFVLHSHFGPRQKLFAVTETGMRTRYSSEEVTKTHIDDLLAVHVPAALCTPNLLFAFAQKTKWSDCRRWRGMIAGILGITHGRTPTQSTLHPLLRDWLSRHGHAWSLTDTEEVTYRLRRMFMCLATRKRNSGVPPRRFPILKIYDLC